MGEGGKEGGGGGRVPYSNTGGRGGGERGIGRKKLGRGEGRAREKGGREGGCVVLGRLS